MAKPSAYTVYLAECVARDVPGCSTYAASIALALSNAIAAHLGADPDADANTEPEPDALDES